MLSDSRNKKPLIARPSIVQKRKTRTRIDSKESYAIKELREELRIKNKEIESLKNKLESDKTISDLKLAFDQLQNFLVNAPISIYFKNRKLEYTYANHAYAAWVNFSLNELTGKRNAQLQLGDYFSQIERKEAEVIESKEPIRNQKVEFSFDNELQLINVYVFPLFDKLADIDGVMTYCVDLSEQIQYKQDLQKAEESASLGIKSRQAFLANLSHEVRTPLHGILGSGALLKSLLKEEQTLDLLDNINRSGTSLLEMVDSMLLLESIEKGDWVIQKDKFDLRKLIEEVNEKYKDQVRHKRVDLQSFVAQGLPEIVIGDAEKIKLVLDVFLSNALKFTDKGFVHLFVQAEQQDTKSLRLKFSVKDTGIGVRKELQPDLFTSFMQGDSSTTKGFQGTGIGLAVAEKTMSYLGGTLGFESAEFKGSNFWFSLDIDKIALDTIIPEALSPSQLPVLLVEDNKINQKIAFFTLKKLGFPVEIAENGFEAVERFKSGSFKIVLMDIQMPVMNGFDATLKIRSLEKLNQESSSLIIALSANTIKEDVEKCFLVGMNEYISKPFSPEKLVEVIQKHIEVSL
jgi:signal transduction histidine kinase/CheY-like chemotaxis protein